MKIIIPSKGRADIIGDKGLRLFPEATLCVGEDEVDAYAKVSKRLLVHPSNVLGMGPLRQWILDHVEDETVVMVDDDIIAAYSQVGFHKRRIDTPEEACAIVERAAIMAADLGCSVFGFGQSARPIGYSNCWPASFNSWVGCVLGVRGRKFRFDTSLRLRGEDIDLCLQALLTERIVYCERRYYWAHSFLKLKGGNACNRSAERHMQETQYLCRKWRPYLGLVQAKGTTRLVVRVVR